MLIEFEEGILPNVAVNVHYEIYLGKLYDGAPILQPRTLLDFFRVYFHQLLVIEHLIPRQQEIAFILFLQVFNL